MAKDFVDDSFKLLQTLQGHTGDVTCCDFVTPLTIVTGSSDKTVRVWDWNVGFGYRERCVSPLRGHKYQVTCVRVSPQGSLLASASVDGHAIIWNVHNCIKLYAITQVNGDAIRVCRFSPNSTILITAGDNGAICVWDLAHRSLIRTIFDHSGTTQALTFTPDSYYLVTACSLENIMIWDTQDLINNASETPCVPLIKMDNIQDMGVLSVDINKRIFTQDGTLSRQYKLASSGNSNEIKIWTILVTFIVNEKASTASEISLELFGVYNGHTSSVTCVRYTSNGQYLVSSSLDKSVKVWDNEGNCVATLKGHTRYVNCTEISKDLSLIVSGSNDKRLLVWDTTNTLTLESDLNQLNHNSVPISENQLLQDDDSNSNNKVTLIEKLDDLVEGSINTCCFHGKRLLAIGSGDKLIRILKISVENNVEEHCFSPLEGHTYAINYLEFSNDGQTLVSCSQDGFTLFWNVNTGEKLRSLPKNILSIKVCRYCPDNNLLLTAGDDEKAILWNIETSEKIASFEGHSDTISGASISPDGVIAVTVSVDANFKVWSLKNYSCLYTQKDAHEYGIQNCDMSPNLEPIPNTTINGQFYLLATCGNDSLVKLWKILLSKNRRRSAMADLLEIKLWKYLQGHGGNVICVRFSQIVGEFICSTATDRQARIWSVYSTECLYVLDHDSIVASCCFNVDCSLLATGCLDRTLWLWKLPQHLTFLSTAADNVSYKSKPIIKWTTSDIINWLKSIDMHKLIPKITLTMLDGKKIAILSEEEICSLLNLDLDEKDKFFKEIRWLKNKEISMEATISLEIPDEFICPITHEIMNEPVICSDGHTYEKNAITEWFMSGKYTSPMSNVKLNNTNVISNIKLRSAIYEFLDSNGVLRDEV